MKKNKKVLKVVTAVTSLAVVSAISLGATMAFLTAQTTEKENVFSSGGVDIILNEHHWNQALSNYSPGQNVPKDPTVETESDESTFVAIAVQYFQKQDGRYVQINDSTFDNIATLQKKTGNDTYMDGINDGWWKGENVHGANVYYYGKSKDQFTELKNGQETIPLFDNVSFSKKLTTTQDVRIIVSAYAVRADTFKELDGTVYKDKVKQQLNGLIYNNVGNIDPNA